MKVRLTKEQKVQVSKSSDIFSIMRQILLRENKLGRSQEHFWIIALNSGNKILNIDLLALGGSNMMIIKPREAFRLPLQKLATQVVLVHNHPSGQLEPSPEDEDLTDHLFQAGEFLRVTVMDHLIITEEKYYSFVDSGLLDILKESKKYVLPYELERRAKKEEKITMARAMKADGEPIDKIVKYTQLSIQEIEQL